ncbi:MAG: glycosyltransferase family 9 protein, partial [Syntrophales bacterium]|nr:glycosyltransferase family 9 protein [Syntrophales bacterium]
TIPTLKAIKDFYPKSLLFLLVRAPNGEILEEEPYIEKIFSVTKHVGEVIKNAYRDIRLTFALRKEKFDLVIDLRASDRGAYLAFLSGAPLRVARHYESLSWRDMFFTHLVPERANDSACRGPVYHSLEIIRPLGIEAKDTVPRLTISFDAQEKIINLLREKNIIRSHKCFATINPFSRWRYKEWPYNRWAEIAIELKEKWNIQPILIGSREDEKRSKEIENVSLNSVINLVGKTSLKELAALLNFAFLHIGIDSAATHIAAAVGTPTITIFGPTDWRDWAPQGDQHRVIYEARDCVPCRRKGCNDSEQSLCLTNLSSQMVLSKIEEFLKDRNKNETC